MQNCCSVFQTSEEIRSYITVIALYGGKNYPDLNYFLVTNMKDRCQKLKNGCTAVACG